MMKIKNNHMEKLEKFNEILKDLNEVSNLYKDAAILRKEASQKSDDATDNRKKVHTRLIEAFDLLKTNVDSWGNEQQNQVNNKVKEAQTLLEKAGLNTSEMFKANQEANKKECQATTKWKDVALQIASLYEEYEIIEVDPSEKDSMAGHDQEKKMLDTMKALCGACQMMGEVSRMREEASRTREEASREREEASLQRDNESKKRYEEITDIYDNVKNSAKLEKIKQDIFLTKRTHCYCFIVFLTLVGLYITGAILGIHLGINSSGIIAKTMLCVILLLLIGFIIVLARRIHRINKALLKMDALIMRMKLSTDRDLGKPYRLDRELEMIYRILES